MYHKGASQGHIGRGSNPVSIGRKTDKNSPQAKNQVESCDERKEMERYDMVIM
jgi:hypothetical protein